jgi:hypothetical protein
MGDQVIIYSTCSSYCAPNMIVVATMDGAIPASIARYIIIRRPIVVVFFHDRHCLVLRLLELLVVLPIFELLLGLLLL